MYFMVRVEKLVRKYFRHLLDVDVFEHLSYHGRFLLRNSCVLLIFLKMREDDADVEYSFIADWRHEKVQNLFLTFCKFYKLIAKYEKNNVYMVRHLL